MANTTYQWHGQQWSSTGCAGSYNAPGWYVAGTTDLLQSSYINPATGKPWTPAELGGGGTATPATTTPGSSGGGTTPTTTPTLTGGVGPGGMTYQEYLAQAPEGTPEADVEAHWLAMVNAPQHVGETRPEIGPGEGGTTADTVSGVPALPPYKPSPEAAALAGQYMGSHLVILESGSGAPSCVPPENVKAISEVVDIPIIVAGGVKTPKMAEEVIAAGASIVHVGTAVDNVYKNKEKALKLMKEFVQAARKGGKNRS